MVQFDGRPLAYDYSDLDILVLTYAVSVHKSQGSEYPCVVIPLLTQHYVMLQQNLVYAAITRGKKLVILEGSKRALHALDGQVERCCKRLIQVLLCPFSNFTIVLCDIVSPVSGSTSHSSLILRFNSLVHHKCLRWCKVPPYIFTQHGGYGFFRSSGNACPGGFGSHRPSESGIRHSILFRTERVSCFLPRAIVCRASTMLFAYRMPFKAPKKTVAGAACRSALERLKL
jgi:hypothetical protein